MSFLHPWAIAIGVVAATVPVLIHFLTRPRPTRMPLSTLRFVREAVRQRRSLHWLRDAILLTLRTLAILLIALAIARPQWGKRLDASDQQGTETVRVLILDVSQSMASRTGPVEQLERGRTIAASYLRYRPGLAANLILAGARPRGIFDGPSTNFEALIDELSQCRALPQRLDVNRAIDLAARMLAPTSEHDQRRRQLVIISDFQRSNWTKANFATLSPDTQVQLESVAAATAPTNLAILRVDGRAAAATDTPQLDVEVANYSPHARKITVDVALDRSTGQLSGVCPPNRSTTLSTTLGRQAPGWRSGEARLVGVDDALAADNTFPFVLHVRPKPTFVLLTRQATGKRPTSSLFLTCALAPAPKNGNTSIAPSVLRNDPAALDRAAIARGDLILLDHPGKLPNDAVKLLAGLMRRGRPILYVASEPIDATNLKRLCEAAGSGLQLPVEFAPPPAGQLRKDLFFTTVRNDSQMFNVFGDSLPAVLGRLRFAGGLASRRLDRGLETDILAAYNDGTAAIVHTASDAGSLTVINADLTTSNLPKTSAFVPMLAELIEQTLHRNATLGRTHCGEALVAQLPADCGAALTLGIRGPNIGVKDAGARPCGELIDEGVGVTWRWAEPDVPGVYRVEHDGKPIFATALTVPAEESQLETLPPHVLTTRLAAGRSIVYHGMTDEGQHRDDFWKWLTVACVVCLLGEVLALSIFRT